ncbi:MAG: FKBP-type peptidyl-prolyl cis-trans isomerase [Acutalibacteraceae bacterium]|nr:FKBP-type peptidyl-prolyl cis-trans isomerase [Acutalibacteraceae bacterium]
MKRFLSLTLVIFSLLTLLTACGKTSNVLFVNTDFDKVMTLAEYKGLELDTSSDDFKELFDNTVASDVKSNSLYMEKTEGTVSEGDIANIDFVGKKDGVAFDGGTGASYDLEIGSGSFIPGFESGLIGVKIGDTVDLNLTFPKDYGKEELNGQDVVFTVTVNSVQTTEGVEPKDIYKDLGYETLEKYESDVKERAIKNYFLEAVTANSEIKEYPEEDIKILQTQIKDALENNISTYYGMTLDAYITKMGTTLVEFESDLLNNQIKPLIEDIMPLYAILEKEGVKVTQKDMDAKLDEIVKEYEDAGTSVDAATLKKSLGEYSVEGLVVEEKAYEIIKENAKIK